MRSPALPQVHPRITIGRAWLRTRRFTNHREIFDTDPPIQQRESRSGGRVSAPAVLRNADDVGLADKFLTGRGRRGRRPSSTTPRITIGRVGLRTRRVAGYRGHSIDRLIYDGSRSAGTPTLLDHTANHNREGGSPHPPCYETPMTLDSPTNS